MVLNRDTSGYVKLALNLLSGAVSSPGIFFRIVMTFLAERLWVDVAASVAPQVEYSAFLTQGLRTTVT